MILKGLGSLFTESTHLFVLEIIKFRRSFYVKEYLKTVESVRQFKMSVNFDKF